MIKEIPAGVLLKLKVLPRSSRCELVGRHGDALKIKVTAPPLEGRANEEIIEFLAEALGIKKGRLTIITGHKSQHKTVAITGCNQQDLDSLTGK
ncbi:MAG: uncharacterized protein QG555_199 [Thermodesulfobacteriota bacterium]|jgi:uncharacterized protein (TIGR00251 family)|nr:uncharacterized protein [Thermodesulfobacteriota bacterium]